MTGAGDPAVLVHLEQVRQIYADTGAIEYVRGVVRETWRTNLGRWSPERHFDDTNTLGYQTHRNVNNRISRTIDSSEVLPSVLAETETGIVMLGLAGFRLRVVKAPVECGLTPDFDRDFDWSTSATRETAASRNSGSYYPLAAGELTLDAEYDPRPLQRRHIDSCREVFLVWAAELKSDRTAGWLGLPQTGDLPWMGIVKLWLDEPTSDGPNAPASGIDYVDEDEAED
ncbi:hypothetical protein [Jiangella alkaliphila]|nr:hypothetical protein [Jiangella alkaliphila]